MTRSAREALGWRPELDEAFARVAPEGAAPMRVVLAERGAWQVSDGEEELTAVVPGRLRHRSRARNLPVVGDWVAVRRATGGAATIEAVVPRLSELTRRDPDQRSEQVLVANVDRALVVMGLDGDFNLRRLERFLTLLGGAGVAPAVVLSKADLAGEAATAARQREVEEVAPGVPVLAVNLLEADARSQVEPLLAPATTAVLLGSSGTGKSTLINSLLGQEVQRTAPVRSHDSRGRHTTTRRQLFRLPGGALVIDTPGIRELEPWLGPKALAEAFPEIAKTAAGCRFRDCRHDREPGCRVRAAVERGAIAPERLEAWRKLAGELGRRR